MSPYQILGVPDNALPVTVAAAYQKVLRYPLTAAERELADLAYRTIMNQHISMNISSNAGAALEKAVDFGINIVKGYVIGYALAAAVVMPLMIYVVYKAVQ